MKYIKSYENLSSKISEKIDLKTIKLEKPLELVNTNDFDEIISLYNKGFMPLDRRRVLTMVKTLQKGGVLPPIKITKENILIDGHHRYMAYKLANKEYIPYEYITEEEV